MIQFDYLLERDEADEVRQFRPDKIPTNLPNIVYIEAPNSSGKSTLLNILALGFHGLKKDNLNEALKNKMRALASSSHQKLVFSFRVTNEDGSLELTSERESPDGEIIVREIINGKSNLLTPENFHRQYNLIYDVPDNPTERLNQLVYEIRDIQKMYGYRLGAFRNYIREVTTAVQRGRDPKRVEQLKGLIDTGTSELSRMNQTLDVDEAFLETLENYYYARLLERKSLELANYDREIEQLEAKIKKGMGKIKRMNKRYQGELEKVRSFLSDMKERQKQIGSLIEPFLPKDERHHLDIWSRIDIDRGLEDFEITNTLDTEILALQRVLMKQYSPDQDRKCLIEARVYSELIDFLTAYRNSDVVLPGDRTIDEFIEQLEETNKQYRDLMVKAENFNKVVELLNNQREDRRVANKMLANLLKLKEESSLGEDDIIDEEDDKELEKLKGKRNALEKTVGDYIHECAKRNINIDNVSEILNALKSSEAMEPYIVYDDVQLGDAVNEKRSEIIALQTSIRSKSDTVRLHRKELDRLEKLEPHKYQDRLHDLDRLIKIVMLLEQKLSKDYDANIESIIKKSVDKGRKDEEYFDAVAKYLGRRVGYVRHLDESLEVSKVDLIEGVIATKTGKRIRLTDMGTGQSQSAYLTGLLNTDDRRRIIAIFDEVAMMDVASLEPIYNKLRELYKQDRLLLGIVVQKGETTKVVSKVEA